MKRALPRASKRDVNHRLLLEFDVLSNPKQINLTGHWVVFSIELIFYEIVLIWSSTHKKRFQLRFMPQNVALVMGITGPWFWCLPLTSIATTTPTWKGAPKISRIILSNGSWSNTVQCVHWNSTIYTQIHSHSHSYTFHIYTTDVLA